uniref:Uncharacterized protein n=1 Tax=Arundo donax TaxID=35708 RepID=A0A0A8ZT93_ARUDO
MVRPKIMVQQATYLAFTLGRHPNPPSEPTSPRVE